MKKPRRCIVISNQKNTSQVSSVRDFSIGCRGVIKTEDWWIQQQNQTDWWDKFFNQDKGVLVFQGIIRGNGHIMRWLSQNNYPYFYIDHAYFLSGYRTNQWMRVSANGLFPQKFYVCDSARWNKYFVNKVKLKNWTTSGKKNILVLPPTQAVMWSVSESNNWLSNTIEEIKKHTDRNIIVREKPGQPLINEAGDIIGKSKAEAHNIEQDLENAHCVITYNSNVAVQAIIKGIPVICNGAHPAQFISNRFEDIENLKEFDRQPWLNFLSYRQFNTMEFRNGVAWNILNQ